MKASNWIAVTAVALWLSSPLLAQDSTRKVRPPSIVKFSIGNSLMYLLYPRYGIKYIGVGYEWFKNSKTSFNGYLDYYHIQDGSFNNPASYNYLWQLDNSGTKNIVSLRTLYKWYPLHKIKYAKGGVMDILRGIFWIHCSSGHFMWCLFYSLLAKNLFLFIFDLPI